MLPLRTARPATATGTKQQVRAELQRALQHRSSLGRGLKVDVKSNLKEHTRSSLRN